MTAIIGARDQLLRAAVAAQDRLRRLHAERDRGDVPGWVLITLMTAGLVTALWLVAEPLLKDLFTNAVESVKGP